MIKEKQTIESFRSFSWVTSKIRGSFVSELLRASWHSALAKTKEQLTCNIHRPFLNRK